MRQEAKRRAAQVMGETELGALLKLIVDDQKQKHHSLKWYYIGRTGQMDPDGRKNEKFRSILYKSKSKRGGGCVEVAEVLPRVQFSNVGEDARYLRKRAEAKRVGWKAEEVASGLSAEQAAWLEEELQKAFKPQWGAKGPCLNKKLGSGGTARNSTNHCVFVLFAATESSAAMTMEVWK
ncbi:hypothetical protein HXX76_000539 [Chlamydomonas incerta]|uniref:Uncharacterized protein n=1 Tax=Chlamydomonas incerta TaxID=51695 RepID=A0A835WET9_CHLIN|nr:hypothetical protein HXX76_000539 [Chlamydomonas incerta]|eukprot:KAG2445936.1 hypothetical protein HXX76_000539 [Chlamydomonas incerta]